MKKISNNPEAVTYVTEETVLDEVKTNNPQLYKRLQGDAPEAFLAKILITWRLYKGRSQRSQAKLVGCGRSTYQTFEEARRGVNPGFLTLWKIANTYEVGLLEFFAGPWPKYFVND
jgi:hypothetical protein